MELVGLGEVELVYTSLDPLDYGSDGQLYGTMEGRLTGDRVGGMLRLTNLAHRRADNVNVPRCAASCRPTTARKFGSSSTAPPRCASPTTRASS